MWEQSGESISWLKSLWSLGILQFWLNVDASRSGNQQKNYCVASSNAKIAIVLTQFIYTYRKLIRRVVERARRRHSFQLPERPPRNLKRRERRWKIRISRCLEIDARRWKRTENRVRSWSCSRVLMIIQLYLAAIFSEIWRFVLAPSGWIVFHNQSMGKMLQAAFTFAKIYNYATMYTARKASSDIECCKKCVKLRAVIVCLLHVVRRKKEPRQLTRFLTSFRPGSMSNRVARY